MEFKLKDNNANNHFINQYNENLSTLIKLRSEFISLKARLSKAEETLESFKAQKTNDYKYQFLEKYILFFYSYFYEKTLTISQ